MLVVVIVVGSFAYFVSSLQTASQNRSSFISNIQNENLQILNMQLSPNNPDVLYTIYNSTVSYDILMLSSNSVELLNSTGQFLNSTADSTVFPLYNGTYNSIGYSTTANISSGEITFGNGDCSFGTATWNYANMTIRNLNIQNSAVARIEVNGLWLPIFYETNGAGQIMANISASTPPLTIPAKESVYIALNLAPYAIPRNDSLKVTILSSAGNYFTTFYGSPTAVISQSVNVENSAVSERDVPTFDGSESFANQSSYIEAYIWRIDVPNNTLSTWNGSWTETSHIATVYATGEILQYRPEAFFNDTQMANLNITGPFRVTLTVVDSYGLIATSQPVVFPTDGNIAPAGSLTLDATTTCNSGYTVTVTVSDIFGSPLANAPVIFTSATSGVIPLQSLAVTNSTGQAGVCVQLDSGVTAGVVEIESGNLSPLYVQVPTT